MATKSLGAAVRDQMENVTQRITKAIPRDVDMRVERAKRTLAEIAPRNNECMEFWRGNQYIYRSKENYLVKQGTLIGEGKPRHRVRTTRNLILPIVRHEVAYATQRVPSYQVAPAKNDPEIISAAAVAERVAAYGYTEWGIQQVTEEVITHSIVSHTGEGFAWPYFDTSVGPYVDTGEGSVGLGEIRIEVLGPNEVAWETGVSFDDSPWYVVRRAIPKEEVEGLPGFVGGKIVADAQADPILSDSGPDLVLLTDYLERPSSTNPAGRRLTMANNRIILPPEEYPYTNAQGEVIDAPVLHKLSYILDPDSDRDIGLGPSFLDPQRTINDCTNKQLEWKNLALFPQMMSPAGSFPKKFRPTDVPGAHYVYNPVAPGQEPKWRETPQIPRELSELKAEAISDMQRIASQQDIPHGVEAGKAISVLIEKDQNARQSFLARLARFHSGLMKHCLNLVSVHYSEQRTLKVNGRNGWENIADFRGADLKGQIDVIVMPDSIEPRTRQALEQRVLSYADRQWITPEKAMAAIEQGTAADLVDSYELDVARAHRVIQKIVAGPEIFLQDPLQPSPDGTLGDVPSWMPRPFDNVPVHYSIFTDFAKTVEFERQDDDVKEAVYLYIQGLDYLKQQAMLEQQQQAAAQAQQLGMANATRPPGNAQQPSLPGMSNPNPAPQAGRPPSG